MSRLLGWRVVHVWCLMGLCVGHRVVFVGLLCGSVGQSVRFAWLTFGD